jgi:hypothetical protein
MHQRNLIKTKMDDEKLCNQQRKKKTQNREARASAQARISVAQS